jgi:hypothetical protein
LKPRQEEKLYGMFGWKEFHRNRKDILDEFDRAKEYNSSRPVRLSTGWRERLRCELGFPPIFLAVSA